MTWLPLVPLPYAPPPSASMNSLRTSADAGAAVIRTAAKHRARIMLAIVTCFGGARQWRVETHTLCCAGACSDRDPRHAHRVQRSGCRATHRDQGEGVCMQDCELC